MLDRVSILLHMAHHIAAHTARILLQSASKWPNKALHRARRLLHGASMLLHMASTLLHTGPIYCTKPVQVGLESIWQAYAWPALAAQAWQLSALKLGYKNILISFTFCANPLWR